MVPSFFSPNCLVDFTMRQRRGLVLWCLSLRLSGVYWVQVVMEYLVIAFVPCVIINMLYGIKRDNIYM